MHIEHAVLKGITPEMVAWWFGNIGGEIELGGTRVNKYLAWHPQDHICWELAQPGLDGRASVGAKFRIVEAFGRNPDFYVDAIDTVTRLDATGFTGESYHLGLKVSHLNHDFHAVAGGTQYLSTLTIGSTLPLVGKLINAVVRRFIFPEAMGRAWLKHNVEEVGLLEHIVPALCAGSPSHLIST
jgi:hypothetical protein